MSTHDCGKCFGTGRNKKGGPCKQCRGTGKVGNFGAGLDLFGAVMRLAIFLVIVVVIVVSLIAH